MSFDAQIPAPDAGDVFFDRRELNDILRVYGRKVAEGEWRDYAMSSGADQASFCVYRRTSEQPLYRIEKRPALQRRQGQWAVVGQGGMILKRGRELGPLLRVFDGKRFSLVE